MIPSNLRLRGTTVVLVAAIALTGCGSEPVRPDRARVLADGVTRAESLATMDQLGGARTVAPASSDEHTCTLKWEAPDSVIGCGSAVPAVVPPVPWLQHSGQARDPGEIEQREPIHITFPDTAVWAITLTSTGALKCTGTYGRLVGFRDGVQVTQADNALIDPSDCGEDDVTIGVQGQLPPDVHIDIATDGGSTHFQWWELNDNWSNGNPHRPWSMIKQGLLNGLEQTRTNYNRGGIRLSSGYRCPHGNTAVGSDAPRTSFHMHGRAADMFSADHAWTRSEFNKLRQAAAEAVPASVELFQWTTYDDHHLHAAW